jgi:hypothetical protein
MTAVAIGFELAPVFLPVEQLLPSHKVPAALLASRKYL